MCNIKITLAYDGTNYHGFQEQRGTRFLTVQSVLEDRLTKLAGKNIRVIGASRTDAGVHARGQVINFITGSWPVPVERLARAANGILPEDIVVLSAEKAPDNFHARFSAVAKTYCYTVYNSRVPSPFWRLYSLHVPLPLDIEAMREAARYLLGKHDFAVFRALGTPVRSTERMLRSVAISREGLLVRLELRADGFLYHMARMIAGTLLRVGLGKVQPEAMPAIMAGQARNKTGPVLPARGLCLEQVEYGNNIELF